MKKMLVAFDPGGAELVAAYYKVFLNAAPALFIADGPAVNIFQREGYPLRCLKNGPTLRESVRKIVKDFHIHTAFCSTGTGDYELEIIKELKACEIPTYVLLDHWTNYRERFGYPCNGWKNNLPEKVIFFDDYAWELGVKYGFPPKKMLKQDNPIQRVLMEKIPAIRAKMGSSNEKFRVLYLSDTIAAASNRRTGRPDAFGFDEFTIFEEIYRELINGNVDRELVVRLHPMEETAKYQDYLGWPGVLLSTESDLIKDLLQSDMIIGSFTMALIHAAEISVPAYSYLPEATPCLLPEEMRLFHPNLKTVHHMEELMTAIADLHTKKRLTGE